MSVLGPLSSGFPSHIPCCISLGTRGALLRPGCVVFAHCLPVTWPCAYFTVWSLGPWRSVCRGRGGSRSLGSLVTCIPGVRSRQSWSLTESDSVLAEISNRCLALPRFDVISDTASPSRWQWRPSQELRRPHPVLVGQSGTHSLASVSESEPVHTRSWII